MKSKYDMLAVLKNKSGAGWDDVEKTVVFSDEVWEELIKVSATRLCHIYLCTYLTKNVLWQGDVQRRQFKDKPFPCWDVMDQLVGGTTAKGAHALHFGGLRYTGTSESRQIQHDQDGDNNAASNSDEEGLSEEELRQRRAKRARTSGGAAAMGGI
jgi:hypothetical protein